MDIIGVRAINNLLRIMECIDHINVSKKKQQSVEWSREILRGNEEGIFFSSCIHFDICSYCTVLLFQNENSNVPKELLVFIVNSFFFQLFH
jgi:hypothetical protein